VVEGCGSNGCEYMTGGMVVILGSIGDDFGAGFTGGLAFVYNPAEMFAKRVNPTTVLWQRVAHPHWQGVLHDLVTRHVTETTSQHAARLLNDWNRALPRFWQIVPKEFVEHLEAPLAVAVAQTA
jgi:glutamate synthase (NADPH) large chain